MDMHVKARDKSYLGCPSETKMESLTGMKLIGKRHREWTGDPCLLGAGFHVHTTLGSFAVRTLA